MRLFVGDDWAEDHHDVEVMDSTGRRLAKARLPEGVAGMTRLHTLIGEAAGDQADLTVVRVAGILPGPLANEAHAAHEAHEESAPLYEQTRRLRGRGRHAVEYEEGARNMRLMPYGGIG